MNYEHCVDCGRPLIEPLHMGRCHDCACAKYGLPEKREPEFQPRKEP